MEAEEPGLIGVAPPARPGARAAATRPRPAEGAGRVGRFVSLLLSEYFVLLLSALYALAIWPFVPEIASPDVISDILSDMMPLLIVAIGETFVLIVAGIDLSITAIVSFAAVVGASVMTGQGGYLAHSVFAVPGAILAMLLVGLLIGLLNGFANTVLGMPSFIVTLATRMFFAGSAIWYTTFHTKSSSIADLPGAFTNIADGQLFQVTIAGGTVGLPYTYAIAAAIIVAAHVVLSRTMLGRWIYAVGANPRTAHVSGIPVAGTIVATFAISGLCASVASVIYTARIETGSPITGENILLDVIGAAVIGGTSLFGGKGKVLWTVFGVLFLVLLDTSMKLLGASLFLIFIVKGGVILFAAIVDALRNRLLAGR